MATSPMPAPLTLEQQFAALAHRQVSVSYALVFVLLFIISLASAGAWFGLKMWDAQMARAEKQESKYDDDRKAFADALAANVAQRSKDTSQQQATIKIVDTRDKSTDAQIAQVLRPDASLATIAAGLTLAYSATPAFGQVSVSPDGLVALSGPQAQQATATKLDADRLTLDLVDEKKLLGLEQDKTGLLAKDLSTCQANGKEAQKVIADYKAIAKVSKWKKILHGAEAGLGVAAGIAFGVAIGKAAH